MAEPVLMPQVGQDIETASSREKGPGFGDHHCSRRLQQARCAVLCQKAATIGENPGSFED